MSHDTSEDLTCGGGDEDLTERADEDLTALTHVERWHIDFNTLAIIVGTVRAAELGRKTTIALFLSDGRSVGVNPSALYSSEADLVRKNRERIRQTQRYAENQVINNSKTLDNARRIANSYFGGSL